VGPALPHSATRTSTSWGATVSAPPPRPAVRRGEPRTGGAGSELLTGHWAAHAGGVSERVLQEPTLLIRAASADKSRHGHAIAQEVKSLSGNRVVLRTGTLHGSLDRLLKDGLIKVRREEVVDGRARKVCALAPLGSERPAATMERMGERVSIDTDGPPGQAQWAKTRYGITTQTLPNGYCGLPVQKTCPHANACPTCPVFLTGPGIPRRRGPARARGHRDARAGAIRPALSQPPGPGRRRPLPARTRP
jgi:DNA-binding PadR family transcriptional regulator